MTSHTALHALSFDIEDWFHLVEVSELADTGSWPGLPTIVERRTRQILGILRDHDVRATFFILGWIADRYPDLVGEIASEGHELASHSYWHRPVYALTPEDFDADLEQTEEAIVRASGQRPVGFRAPSFSIRADSTWAFDVLSRRGYEYDASVFPGERAHGGFAADTSDFSVAGAGGSTIAELPMSTISLRLGSRSIGVGFTGGGYFRVIPLPVIEWLISREERAGRPAVVYLHPRDFAVDCPRVSLPLQRRFRTYWGISTTEPKLRTLLERFQWGTCREVLRQVSPVVAA
jgi:peptidoglycan-N-acetylglucosamine deacetylase